MRIVVGGLVAQYPLGGVAWDYVQYPVGLARLGHDVWYIEDTGLWPYDPRADALVDEPRFNVAHLEALMADVGLAGRWGYHAPGNNRWYGLDAAAVADVFATADIVLNVSGVMRNPDRLAPDAALVYIDSDPVFTQLKLIRGQSDFRAHVDAHHVHFSFGETLDDVPDTGHRWLPTRQPVLTPDWAPPNPPGTRYTTIMNWSSYADVTHGGRRYGQKNVEMDRFIDLPGQVRAPLELALAPGRKARAPVAQLRASGWHIVDPRQVCGDHGAYRSYIQASRGEWSVAKHGYVAASCGWFSGRSACYLAAGRPVVVQDTGFSAVLPTGEGLLAFDDPGGAVAALAAVEADYDTHAEAAAAIARELFDSETVLSSLLDRVCAATNRRVPR